MSGCVTPLEVQCIYFTSGGGNAMKCGPFHRPLATAGANGKLSCFFHSQLSTSKCRRFFDWRSLWSRNNKDVNAGRKLIISMQPRDYGKLQQNFGIMEQNLVVITFGAVLVSEHHKMFFWWRISSACQNTGRCHAQYQCTPLALLQIQLWAWHKH